jgi:hypothetical protein
MTGPGNRPGSWWTRRTECGNFVAEKFLAIFE